MNQKYNQMHAAALVAWVIIYVNLPSFCFSDIFITELEVGLHCVRFCVVASFCFKRTETENFVP